MAATRPALLAATALVATLAACFSGSGNGPTRVTAGRDECNAPLVLAAAAELYRAGGGFVGHGGYQDFTSPAAFESEAYALYQADTLLLASGMGIHLLHGAGVAEAAAGPGAPADENRNGTNLDETFDALMARLAAASGAEPLGGTWPTLAEYDRGMPEFAQPLDLLRLDRDLGSQRWDRGIMVKALCPETLGRALYVKAITAAGRLAQLQAVGTLHGAVPDEGLRGLIALQAAWDEARFLLDRCAFDGLVLGGVDPAVYDPALGLRWFPARIQVTETASLHAGLPPEAAELSVTDDASTLTGQAELLRGAVELYWLSSPTNPLAPYRALFDGAPFPAAQQAGSPHRTAAGLVQVLLANLKAMHFRPESGTFVDEWRGGSPGRAVTTLGAATAIRALAGLEEATAGTMPGVKELVRAQAEFLAENLIEPASGLAWDGFDLDRGPLGSTAELVSQLAMVEALLGAYRVMEEPALLARALDLAAALERAFWVPALKLLRTRRDSNLIVWTPATTAWLASGLRAVRADGLYPGASDLFARVLLEATARLGLLLAEEERTGETVGDGNPDTNGNGIVETALAGGAFGRAAVFAEMRELIFTTAPPAGAAPPVATVTVTWSQTVQPVFINSCHCHLNGSKSGGLDLSSHETMMRGGGSQARYPIVVPFNASQSLLYLKLSLDTPPVGARMPYFQDPLKPAALKELRDWINQGARNN